MGSLHGDMAADSEGNVYLSTGDSIHVFGPDGKFLKDLGKETRGVHGMKVRKQGGEDFLFIAQNGLKRVAKLKLDGTAVWTKNFGFANYQNSQESPNKICF